MVEGQIQRARGRKEGRYKSPVLSLRQDPGRFLLAQTPASTCTCCQYVVDSDDAHSAGV